MRDRLLSLTYHSISTTGSSSLDLDEILITSRTRNRAAGITGILLAEGGRYVQLLEGPEAAVRALTARIRSDPRHQQVEVLAEEEVASRQFPDWAMAHRHVDEIEALPFGDRLQALLEARRELPAPSTRADRLRAWFSAGTR